MELRIKELCKAKSITQKKLAELIGITPVGLSKSLGGNTTIATLEKIAIALNVEVADLFANTSCASTFVCPHCGTRLKVVESACLPDSLQN